MKVTVAVLMVQMDSWSTERRSTTHIRSLNRGTRLGSRADMRRRRGA